MVEINQPSPGFNQNQNQANNQFQSNQTNSQNQAFNQQTPPKGLFKIPEHLLQLIPWIPVGLELLTGQRIPATGVLADLLSAIQQVQFSVNQVLTQQQQIWNKLESLESNASNQLNNLSQQVASANNSFKLLATETKRSLEFNSPKLERPEPFNE